MTRNEFERKYLNKMVEVILYDNDTFKGYLYSTNEYMNKTKLLDVKNYYFVGNDIRDNGVRFRKSHIKKIKLVSCLSINKHYKLGDEKIEIERLRKNNLRIREIYDAYLWLIIDLALDYDGFNTVDGLKGLIDEIKSYAYMAIDNDTKTPFYKDGDGNDLNILLEKIGK